MTDSCALPASSGIRCRAGFDARGGWGRRILGAGNCGSASDCVDRRLSAIRAAHRAIAAAARRELGRRESSAVPVAELEVITAGGAAEDLCAGSAEWNPIPN